MYIFRADGNSNMGAGHLMRCRTIALALEELLGSRLEILFLCADEDSGALAREAGFAVKVLDSDYRDLKGELAAWEELWREKEFSENKSGRTSGNVILVDSYFVTDAYLEALKQYGKVVLLDDMGRKPYPVDGVINYNAFASREHYEELYRGTGTACYTGAGYVPVRGQFLEREYRILPEVKHVLITAGGGDENNIAGAIFERIYEKGCRYTLVTGAYNPHLETLRQMALQCPGLRILHNVQDMAGLMVDCDLAVTAGGTTIYELAALGVPFLCFSCAENQEALTEYIGREKIAGYAGAWHKNREEMLERLEQLVKEYMSSREQRENCFVREREMTDGRGAGRIARILTGMRK